MGLQKNLVKPITRRDFLRDSARAGTSMCVAGLAIKSSVVQASLAVPAEEGPLKATVVVDAGTVLHRINPNIYGSIIEHIGRIIYGGLYDEGSKLSDEEGFRKDVMDAARAWGVPILRWPGGDFASGYHWEDGVGPKGSRPRRFTEAWREEESNHFGTDEFIDYCRKIGAEPYICVNLGTGTIDEAANWVEYCNGTGNTSYANLRREYGHDEPHRVHYWGLGNEVFGEWQIGHMNAEDYAKLALECGKMMKWVDPTIQLVAVGCPPDPDWNRIVLTKMVHIADYISVHDYEGNPDYYEELGTIRQVERNLEVTAAAITLTDYLRGQPNALMLSIPDVRTKKPIQIAVDEWNIWYRKRDLYRPNPVEERYNLRDALWVASVLNLFQRQGDKVTLACLAQMLNSIGAIFTSPSGMFLQTIYFPMKLYRNQCGARALRSAVESPTFSSKSYMNVPYLDVSATLDDARKTISVAVVNRHETEPIRATVAIQNGRIGRPATSFEINGATPETENSFSEPDNVRISQKEVSGVGDKFDYVFPAHSVTLLKLGLA